jgi:hypothetical protein
MSPETIRYDQAYESQTHQFVTEASTLGWKPGYWPERIETAMGNGLPFLRGEQFRPGLSAVTYYQANGCITLTVYND